MDCCKIKADRNFAKYRQLHVYFYFFSHHSACKALFRNLEYVLLLNITFHNSLCLVASGCWETCQFIWKFLFFINISFLSHLALLKTKFNSPFSVPIFSHSQTTSFPVSVKYQQHTMPFRNVRVYLDWVFFPPGLLEAASFCFLNTL